MGSWREFGVDALAENHGSVATTLGGADFACWSQGSRIKSRGVVFGKRERAEVEIASGKEKKPPRSFLWGGLLFRWIQEPTLASSSLVITFWILNCSACMPGSERKESLPK